MAPGPRLTLAIAQKRFAGRTTPLFENFTLDVAPAGVVAILGPSGIGKSTLLRLIAGIDTDFSGTIMLDGVSARHAPPPGFVFQDPRLLPWLTALDNIGAANAKMSHGTARRLLGEVGLIDQANTYPHQLSGGMQRRVALARALAVNASLLLLDEPFVSLDRPLVAEMHQVLTRLIARNQPTVLFVTHLPEDAASLADRVVVLAGQPAGIVADTVLPVPRDHRDPVVVQGYVDYLQTIASDHGS